MGKCVERIVHEKCGSNALQVFQQEDGSYDGYCFSCGSVVADPYKDKPEGYKPDVKVKTDEEIKEDIEEISEYPTVDIPQRKLKKVALEYFGVKYGMNMEDGVTPYSYYFPYPDEEGNTCAYKAGLFELNAKGKKQMWVVGNLKKALPFGWFEAIATGEKTLYITEGEHDAVALWQIIMRCQHGTQYQDKVPAIISPKSGASSVLSMINQMGDQIRRQFKEVVLVLDNDKAGKKAEEEVLKHYPDFMAVDLPCKDANECLIKGRVKAAFNAVKFKASRPKNTRLVWGQDLIEAARELPEWGLSWPWKKFTDMTRGIRFGETIYIGAGVKMG
jgi:twinkle protein